MILFLLIVVVVAVIIEKRSLNLPTEKVKYVLEPSKRSVEQGEKFQLCTTIENATKRNMSYLYLEEAIPVAVDIQGADTMELVKRGNYMMHRSRIFIKKKQRVKRSITVSVHQRGIFKFREAKMEFGDFLGLKVTTRNIEQNRSVVVYPKRLSDENLSKVLSDILGEISIRTFLFEDPMLVMGYRDYTGREPLRNISFTMSAKRNQMTVKEFDHTREEMVDLIFDVSFKGDFDSYFEQKETMFCMVRTFCDSFEERGISYRLITNAYYATMDVRGVNVLQSGGSGGNAYSKILEILGMSSGAAMCSTQELLQYAFQNYAQEKEYIYISQRREGESLAVTNGMKKQYGVQMHELYGEDFVPVYRKEVLGL